MCLMRVLQHCIALNDEEHFITKQIFGRSNSKAQLPFYHLSDQSVFNELFKLKHQELTKSYEKDEVSFLNESFNEHHFVKTD